MRNTILLGDARELARTLPDESVHCIVTSPPYFGLRDYGVDGQMGLEDTPDAYVTGMVDLFRELRRALRHDGTLWLNLGDSYYNYRPGAQARTSLSQLSKEYQEIEGVSKRNNILPGLKEKDLIGIPWRVALALQADGWYLRSDIIWHKKSPMPESVTDRPTKAHEYLFLLSKSPQYFYDADAVREPHGNNHWGKNKGGATTKYPAGTDRGSFDTSRYTADCPGHPAGRNKRSVWTLGPEPYPDAHFATFPRSLVRPCILAGTSAYGVCGNCGSPYVRVVERERIKESDLPRYNGVSMRNDANDARYRHLSTTTGWQASCECFGHFEEYEIDAGHGDGTTKKLRRYVPDGPQPDTVPAIVLDPFMGSGTVAQVAIETGRDWLGFELNEDYVQLAYDRIYGAQPALIAQGITA